MISTGELKKGFVIELENELLRFARTAGGHPLCPVTASTRRINASVGTPMIQARMLKS